MYIHPIIIGIIIGIVIETVGLIAIAEWWGRKNRGNK